MTNELEHDEVEWAGAMQVRFIDMDITDYDAGGEAFGPQEASMSRFQTVIAEVQDGSGQWARWNAEDGTIMLFSDAGEAAAGATASVRIVAIGR